MGGAYCVATRTACFCSFSSVLFICIVVLTRRCKLITFFLYIYRFVIVNPYNIVNMPVIYVCCFDSVMRKQVNYHQLNSIYDPYGRNVRPLYVYQI